MRKIQLLVPALLLSFAVKAQMRVEVNPGVLKITDLQGNPIRETNTVNYEGTPYLLPDYQYGEVKFKNGRLVKDVSLRFNIYTNRLFFKREEVEFEFIQQVSEFSFKYQPGPDSLGRVFRNGFPAVGDNTVNTFYEVVADGKIQLLNHHQKYIFERKPYNEPLVKEYRQRNYLYIFLPTGKIAMIKDKDDILQALPDYKDAINKIIAEKKLKLKKDDHVVELFKTLNTL